MSVNADSPAPEKSAQSDGGQPQKPCRPCHKSGGTGKAISLVVALLATVGLVFLIYNVAKRQRPIEVPPVVHPVKSIKIKPANDALFLRYPGTTRAYQQVDVGFQVAGTLEDLPINSGQVLKKNEVIAQLDPTDYQNTLEAKQADYMNAKATLDRVQKLYDAKVYAKSSLDEALALAKIAEANMRIAQKSRNDCVLRAPYDGIVAKRYVDNYQTVTTGQPIISLQDLSKLEIQVDFPEWLVSQARRLKNNATTYAVYDSLPNVKIPLFVKEFAAEADPSTRTYPVRFYMKKNPDQDHVNILPGMTADVTVKIEARTAGKPFFILPVWSVVSNMADNSPYVFVVNESTDPWTVKKRDVKVGQLTGDSIVVEDGLKAGERVVVAGADRLDDGMAVEPLPVFLKPTFDNSDQSEELGRSPAATNGDYDNVNSADGKLEAVK